MSKVWFITGVSTGFGRILAEKVTKRGDIAIGTLRQKDQIADYEKISPGKTIAKILDVNNEKDVYKVVDEIVKEHGKIDVLVNLIAHNVHTRIFFKHFHQRSEFVFTVNGTSRIAWT